MDRCRFRYPSVFVSTDSKWDIYGATFYACLNGEDGRWPYGIGAKCPASAPAIDSRNLLPFANVDATGKSGMA